MHMTPEGLKKFAACSVAALKEGVSLNDSIIDVALSNEMNSDQVKRLVETTNQLAYLSELSEQEDRAFEFDVANYDNIIDGMMPETDMQKTASYVKARPIDLVTGSFQSIEKVAQEKEATIEKWGRNQKLQALKKIASQQRQILDEMESAEHDNLVKLAQHRAIISRDPEALLKMSKFDNGTHLSQVVFGHEKVATEVRRVWSPESLVDIKALSDRLTMCKQAQIEKIALKSKVEEAEGILKEAFIAAAANAAKSAFGGGIKKAVKSPAMPKLKKAYGAFEALDSTNEVRKGTKQNHNAWSSLRG